VITPLNYPIRKFFYLTLLLIPFSSTKAFLPLGELKNDIAIQVGLFGFFLYALNKFYSKTNKLEYPSINRFIIFLLAWFILCSFINIPTVFTSSFKGKSGIGRLISQNGIFFTYSVLILMFFYEQIRNHSSESLFYKLNKYLNIIFWFSSVYAFVEIGYGIYHLNFLEPIYNFLNTIIFKEKSQSWNLGRISGVTQEPPFLAMYLVFVSPWIFYKILERKGILKYLETTGLAIVIYFAGSRTGFIIISIQFLCFVIMAFYKDYYKVKLFEIVLISTMLFFVVFVIIGKDIDNKIESVYKSVTTTNKSNKHNISNITRWGTQKASIKIFKENPIFGVGLGQQPYFLIHNYDPIDVKMSWELRYYKDPKKELWPPGYSMFTRLLAETGFIGAFVFYLFNFLIIVKIIKKYLKDKNEYTPIILVLSVGLIGFYINSFQFDSFRLIGYWFYIAWVYVILNKKDEKQSTSINTSLQ